MTARSEAPEIPSRYYARLAEILQGLGVETAALLAAAQVSPAQLVAAEAKLRVDQVDALVTAALRLSGRADLAFELGRAIKLSSHSIVGYGVLSSPTGDYALRLAARYFRLVLPNFRMLYRADAQRAEVRFQPCLPMSPVCLQFHLEAIAVTVYWEMRELLRDQLLEYDLHLSYAPPPHAARYGELLAARCHFASEPTPGLRVVLPGPLLQRPLPLADPAALKMAETRCRALIQQVIAAGKIADWVTMMLHEAHDSWPTQQELAQALSLSSRTLDRYLEREGARYRDLSLRVRHQRACALLEQGQLGITQIAYELGYADAANFTRAFRRDAGCAPSEYARRRLS